VGIDTLSVDEIQQQLQALDQNRADLEQALAERRKQTKSDLVQEVKDLIRDRGFELTEIVFLLAPRRKRSPGVKTGSPRKYIVYVDPDNENNTYVRGVIPSWMKQKMQEQGYDPGSKDDRNAFKANHLRAVEDGAAQ